jgi:hypothetical protein
MEHKIVSELYIYSSRLSVRYLPLLKFFEKREFCNGGIVLVVKDRYLNNGPD